MSPAKLRIFTATLIGVILVGGSLYLSLQHDAQVVSGAEETLTIGARKHIPVVDSDQDGVPDWQAELVDGEPIFIDASSTEVYIPPDTVTAQFVHHLNQDIATLDAYGMLEETREDLVEAAVKELEKRTMEEIYTVDSLTNVVAIENKESLHAYANIVAGSYYTFFENAESEYVIFDRLTADGNPKHIEKLKEIEGRYDAQINHLLKMEVPERFTFEHIAIVNGLSAMRENVYGMQLLYDDPYYTAARYRRFIEDFLVMKNAVWALYDALYLDEKIMFTEEDALRMLINDLQ